MTIHVFIYLILKTILLINAKNDQFNEELLIETLPNSNIHFYFQFTTVSEHNLNDKSSFYHYTTFPKQFGDIVSEFGINELHLSLTQGQWKYVQWGEPSISVPPGAELWAWFNDNTQIDSIWPKTTRALSGLFCASLNFMNNEQSVQPKYSHRPLGALLYNSTDEMNSSHSRLRYSALPSEIVCAENLTPWSKLLPCGKHKGLAKLLAHPNKLFETKYYSMGIHFRHICLDSTCSKIGVEFKQTLSIVASTEISQGKSIQSRTQVALESIFSTKLDSTCPAALKSLIFIDDSNTDLSLNPQPSEILEYGERKMRVFNLESIFVTQKAFNLVINYEHSSQFHTSPLIQVHRYSISMNQFTNGFEAIIRNPSEDTVRLSYFENIPWFFRVYMNTLRIKDALSGELIEPLIIHYVPALDRTRPHHIEIIFNIKANGSVVLSLKFQNAFLKWNEFPPDAQHGHSLNSALVSYKKSHSNQDQYHSFHNYTSIYDALLNKDNQSSARLVKIYSEVLLIDLPVPDFSMPYNVICLACTAVAIAFGSLHNFTTKKFIFTDRKSKFQKYLVKIKTFFKSKSN